MHTGIQLACKFDVLHFLTFAVHCICFHKSFSQERRVFLSILREVFVGVVDHTQLEELIQDIHSPLPALLSADVAVASTSTFPPSLDGEGGRVQVMAAIAHEAQKLGLLLHQPWLNAVAQVYTALSANNGECTVN